MTWGLCRRIAAGSLWTGQYIPPCICTAGSELRDQFSSARAFGFFARLRGGEHYGVLRCNDLMAGESASRTQIDDWAGPDPQPSGLRSRRERRGWKLPRVCALAPSHMGTSRVPASTHRCDDFAADHFDLKGHMGSAF